MSKRERTLVVVKLMGEECPVCHPALWDARFKQVPRAVLCGKHEGHALARDFRLTRRANVTRRDK